MSDFQGTVARRIFDRLDDHRARRAKTANVYAAELSDCPHVRSVTPVEGLSTHQHVRYPLRIATEALRDRVQEALVEAGVQATTLYDWPVIDPEEFPGAGRLQREILTLPTHGRLSRRFERRWPTTARHRDSELLAVSTTTKCSSDCITSQTLLLSQV
jgi:dTDP-4-amino-4,6-dideoxygalactose transaminase